MGRTIPAFRLAHMYEECAWKDFRNALDRSERKEFDRMFAASRQYISACSYAANPVRIQPIMMSLVFHHYKQLAEMCSTLSQELEHQQQ